MSSVGENIKTLRLERGLSREKLSKKIGITAHGLYQLETGRRKVSLDWLEKISEVLGCDSKDLLDGTPVDEIAKKEDNNTNETSGNYSINDDYLRCAMEIVDDMIDHEFHSRDEKAHILSEVYKVVYDFFENNDDKKDFAKELEKKIIANQGVLKFLSKADLGKTIKKKLLDKKDFKIGKR